MGEKKGALDGKSVLVTGGLGFIGSRLVKALLERNADVRVLVNDEAKLSRIEALFGNPRLHLVRGSPADARTLARQRDSWGVVHLLVHLGVKVPQAKGFCEMARQDIIMNLLPAINLLDALGSSIEGICFASSISVYGRPAHTPVREHDPPHPISSYGATKLAIENFLSAYGQSNKVPVTILRYSTVYGPGETAHRAIPNFMHALSEGRPPMINGDGLEKRDYVYIDDAVTATLLALIKKPERVLNIGSGESHTTRHIAEEVMRLCSVDKEPIFTPRPEPNTDLTCDISAAQNILGYQPQTTLEQGLLQEIEWYRKEVKA